MMTSKVCIVGDFAVGKTSTVERFVNSQFSEKYLTTVGIKVDTKDLSVDGIDHKLVIWDIAGKDQFGEMEFSYLRGAAGYILVADGTRRDTISVAKNLRTQIEGRYGALPHVLLINKTDLKEEWDVQNEEIASLQHVFKNIFLTSAKTGEEVELAISQLVSIMHTPSI